MRPSLFGDYQINEMFVNSKMFSQRLLRDHPRDIHPANFPNHFICKFRIGVLSSNHVSRLTNPVTPQAIYAPRNGTGKVLHSGLLERSFTPRNASGIGGAIYVVLLFILSWITNSRSAKTYDELSALFTTSDELKNAQVIP